MDRNDKHAMPAHLLSGKPGPGPLKDWKIGVTKSGDVALLFIAEGHGKAAHEDRARVLCDRETALEIAKDLVRAVALCDTQDEAAGKYRPNVSVFAISQPGTRCQ